jgi:hypothetical protein
MLVEDRSAGNLAATCSQLRKLCHSSIKWLDLRPLLVDDLQPSEAQKWTQHLQEHFPRCNLVVMHVQEKDSYHAVNYVLPALARWDTGLRDCICSCCISVHDLLLCWPSCDLQHQPEVSTNAICWHDSRGSQSRSAQ